jgi:hypothetical protein
VSRAYNPEGGIDADPEVAAQTRFLLPDIAAAVPYLPPEQRGWAAWRAASVFERLGQPEQAHQSITLAEATARETENQELLSRVHHQQATLLVTRGDLDGAMRLYEQSLAIKESLGDVRGTSATLHEMATRAGDARRPRRGDAPLRAVPRHQGNAWAMCAARAPRSTKWPACW